MSSEPISGLGGSFLDLVLITHHLESRGESRLYPLL